ncbi:MAG TPA: hypothetical protein VM364_01820 [Vicinamibacterales bacterium]|nr:hypothetical protein [Vicinamibacterales bacterium]
MRARHPGVLAVGILAVVVSATAAWQEAPARAASAKIWEGRNAEFEEFIRKAPFQRFEDVPIGVTRPRRGYFDPGGLVESVAWKVLPPGRDKGYWESYRSEIAAYELDKLLELHMVPPAVEKRWKGDTGAAILWVKPVRSLKEVEHLPKPPKWNVNVVRMKMFDNLIGNIDRNQGNLLFDEDWNLYLIDHSRAFVTDAKLPAQMQRIDPDLWARMQALDEPALKAAIGKWIDGGSIRAMLKRRERMQAVIADLLKNGNESLVYVR